MIFLAFSLLLYYTIQQKTDTTYTAIMVNFTRKQTKVLGIFFFNKSPNINKSIKHIFTIPNFYHPNIC